MAKHVQIRPQVPWKGTILRTAVRMLIPFIQLFGLYVIVHGHYSPGGGFQGGVILGSSIILLALVFGIPVSRKYISAKYNAVLSVLGPIIYCGTAALCIFFGGYFLDYSAMNALLPLGKEEWRSLGIFIVEAGVGVGVMNIMISIYFSLASAGTKEKEDRHG